MTRSQRIASMISEAAYIVGGAAYATPSVVRRIAEQLLDGGSVDSGGVIHLPSGMTIESVNIVPSPYPKRRAKKIVRRIHRARLKNRGKAWV